MSNLAEKNANLLGIFSRVGKKIYENIDFYKELSHEIIGLSLIAGKADLKIRYSEEYKSYSIGVIVQLDEGRTGRVYVRVKETSEAVIKNALSFRISEVQATRDFEEAGIKEGDTFVFAYPVMSEVVKEVEG